MKKQEALKMIEAQKETIVEMTGWAVFKYIKTLIEQLDEPETGHADEAPRYVKNILARLRELPEHDREVWLKAIMSEFEQDFSRSKWREGYEQGKFEGEYIPEKVKVPQFVADWIEEARKSCKNVADLFDFDFTNKEVSKWFMQERPFDLVARAWLDGYEVEEEKRYTVKIKAVLGQYLERYYLNNEELTPQFKRTQPTGSDELPTFTRKELESTGFGWVFDCLGIEVREV